MTSLIRRCGATLSIVAIGLSLTGCEWLTTSSRAGMRPTQLVDYSLPLSYVDTSTNQVVEASGTLSAGASAGPSAFSSQYVPVVSTTTLSFAMESVGNRDFVQDALMQRSDVLCEQFIDGLYIRVTERKAALGEIAMVASAVGTFTGGDAGQALNLVSSIAQGTNSLIDSTVMQNQLITLIANQIQANRTRIRDQITKARKEGLKAYPVALALRDVQSYHQTCSFMSGVTSLAVTSNKPDTSAANAASTTTPTNGSANTGK